MDIGLALHNVHNARQGSLLVIRVASKATTQRPKRGLRGGVVRMQILLDICRFFNLEFVLMVQAVEVENYCDVLGRLRENIQPKHPELLLNGNRSPT